MNRRERPPGSYGRYGGGRRQRRLLRASRARFDSYADNLPISVWEEDFSAVRARFDELRRAGISDLCAYLEANPAEVHALAAKVKILGVNRRSVELLGAGTREQLLRQLPNFFNEASFDVFRRELCALAEGRRVFDLENPIGDATGKPRTLWMHVAVADGHEEDLSRVFVSFVDITELKLAEAELREGAASLRLSQEVAGIGQWTIDARTNEMTWSEQMYGILGIDPAVSTGELSEIFEAAVHPDDKALVRRARLAPSSGQERMPIDFRIVRPDGTIRVVWAVPGPEVVDSSGAIVKSTGIVQDITERRKTEEALQRTQKLESLGLLAGGIAHDFNNFLTGLFGYIEVAIAEAGEGSPVAQTLDGAMDAFNRARDLTRQLLTFSTGGAPRLGVLPVDELIEGAVRLSLSGSGVRCLVDLEHGVAPVNGDPGQLSQVLNNILLNSRQAMPEVGTIAISACNRVIGAGVVDGLPAGRYVELAIRDEGIGITAEQLPRIFDPFYTTKPQGTGLGLTTSFSIIRRHGGHIDVDSEPGRGTTITILLPATSAQPVAVDVVQDSSSLAAASEGRVLIMDDEPLIAKAAGRLLAAMGYSVESASDGERAVSMYEAAMRSGKPYDFVILDLTVVGGMGGEAAIEKLLEIDPSVRAIVSSGYSDGPVLSNPTRYGFVGILPKPYRREDIASLLASVFRDD